MYQTCRLHIYIAFIYIAGDGFEPRPAGWQSVVLTTRPFQIHTILQIFNLINQLMLVFTADHALASCTYVLQIHLRIRQLWV